MLVPGPAATELEDRVRDKIQTPYEAIVLRTRQLERLEVTTHLLRQLLRYLQLARRLRTSLATGDGDLANAANSVHEIGTKSHADGRHRLPSRTTGHG